MAIVRPPSVSDSDWQAAAQRSAPLVGVIIITWAACESTMDTQVMRARQAKDALDSWPKLSHKFRERLNEWIRLCLAPSGQPTKPDSFREDVLRLQTIRNNIAHNISAMWIDTANELRVFCIFDNKEYEAEDAAFDYSNGPHGAPWPIKAITYSGDELLAAHNEMRRILGIIGKVMPPGGLPFPPVCAQ